jgi:hypothetical protein
LKPPQASRIVIAIQGESDQHWESRDGGDGDCFYATMDCLVARRSVPMISAPAVNAPTQGGKAFRQILIVTKRSHLRIGPFYNPQIEPPR